MFHLDFGVFDDLKGDKENFSFNSKTQSYIFFKSKYEQFLYKKIKGDFILRAHFNSTKKSVIGFKICNQFKEEISHTFNEYFKLNVLELERKGDVYRMSIAQFGKPFSSTEITITKLQDEVFAGFFLQEKNNTEKIVLTNVRIIKPASKNFIPYQDYIGSNLEIMDIENGLRTVLLSSNDSLQAPNWINNDENLVYNSKGLLYKYNLKNKTTQQIETGLALDNNNDHVFSFDEKILGISHHNKDDNGDSSIYIMNPEGDKNPKKITLDKIGRSYLHGISPDNKTLIYTAFRNNKYDIYGIDINSRKEFQLTNTKDLDDGSEYSPDGKYIYFNSNRTGNMQLWRMDFDGQNPKQLTFNTNYKDWFPHISPNGKWIVFISFPPDIDFGDHPFYKHCTLRLMPVDLSFTPKIIAYIYGGQGTINVSSWSKDSKKIAFMTNSD